jgi:hypothetical protein
MKSNNARVYSKTYKPGDIVMYFNKFYRIREKCNDIFADNYNSYRIETLDGTYGGVVSEYFLIDMSQGI